MLLQELLVQVVQLDHQVMQVQVKKVIHQVHQVQAVQMVLLEMEVKVH